MRLWRRPKADIRKIEKRLDGLATHEDVTKLEDRLKNEKIRRQIMLMTPRQRSKFFRIVGKQLQEGHTKK